MDILDSLNTVCDETRKYRSIHSSSVVKNMILGEQVGLSAHNAPRRKSREKWYSKNRNTRKRCSRAIKEKFALVEIEINPF